MTILMSLDPMALFRSMPGAFAQGLVWGLMALGVYITYRLLDFADLTVDGSLATGGAVAVMLIRSGTEENLEKNPLKCEYFLPSVVGELLAEEKATVQVLKSTDKWYGVTYKEDKPVVVAAIQKLKDQGLYPQGLWD